MDAKQNVLECWIFRMMLCGLRLLSFSVSMAHWAKQRCLCRRCSVCSLLILNMFAIGSELVIMTKGHRCVGKEMGLFSVPPLSPGFLLPLPLTSSGPSPAPPPIFLMTSRCDCWPWLPRPHPEDAGSVPPQTQDQRWGWGVAWGMQPKHNTRR